MGPATRGAVLRHGACNVDWRMQCELAHDTSQMFPLKQICNAGVEVCDHATKNLRNLAAVAAISRC